MCTRGVNLIVLAESFGLCREHEEAIASRNTNATLTEYIRLKVLSALRGGVAVDHDVLSLSNPPLRTCTSIRSMYAFGQHFRADVEEHLVQYATDDSTIAVITPEADVANEHSIGTIGEVRRVGHLVEILEVTFYRKKVILMVGSWVRKGTVDAPTLIRDRHGFWIADITARPRDLHNKYIFPAMVSQVSAI